MPPAPEIPSPAQAPKALHNKPVADSLPARLPGKGFKGKQALGFCVLCTIIHELRAPHDARAAPPAV
ncbi:hypothetical protein NDU88_012271 [Pleurodeles waltl]|uniref:Uncharacterized protein n=1 Tax=Pleurodeles waltl TaxID=8319 RepID=A0AAV7R105_PLEWA|nr:hypothetical protein NDU88_012271 [Pleurodeles waltl]